MNPPPSTEAREALKSGYRDALRELGKLLSSLGLSAKEAAWRGSDTVAILHVREARLVIVEALAAAKHLERLNASGAEQ
jgi:hypothetical protein